MSGLIWIQKACKDYQQTTLKHRVKVGVVFGKVYKGAYYMPECLISFTQVILRVNHQTQLVDGTQRAMN